jgi:hypothetical protein
VWPCRFVSDGRPDHLCAPRRERQTIKTICMTLLRCAFHVSNASAQADFTGLTLRIGDVVQGTESSGHTTTGRLRDMTSSRVVVSTREFAPAPGLRIERLGDRVWDGAAMGAGIGSLVGLVVAGGECGVDWPEWKCSMAGTMWGGLIGTLIDWTRKERVTVYIYQPPAPLSGRTVSLRVRWQSQYASNFTAARDGGRPAATNYRLPPTG